jgi:hypothetical protein
MELNLKALAKLSGDRKMEMAALKDVQPLTGYIRGGVTAIAGKKDFPVYPKSGSSDRIRRTGRQSQIPNGLQVGASHEK